MSQTRSTASKLALGVRIRHRVHGRANVLLLVLTFYFVELCWKLFVKSESQCVPKQKDNGVTGRIR